MKIATQILLFTLLYTNINNTDIEYTNNLLGSIPTEGCTDSEAINYNPDATYGENQCWYQFEQYLLNLNVRKHKYMDM